MNEDVMKTAIALSAPLPENELEEEQQSPFHPMVHGKAIDAMVAVGGTQPTRNPKTGVYSLEALGVQIVLSKYSENMKTLGTSTNKLMAHALTIFTERNHTGNTSRKVRDTKVTFSLNDYAEKNGINISSKNDYDNFRKKVRKDIKVAESTVLKWSEKVRGLNGDYCKIGIITSSNSILSGVVTLYIDPVFAEYAVKLPLTQMHDALYKVSDRCPTAYQIGFAMLEHNNMDTNIKRGTRDMLKISNILKRTELPSFEKIQRDRASWRGRIQEPFTSALDHLVNIGFLTEWNYAVAGGKRKFKDDKSGDFESYTEWADETYIKFTIANAIDHTARLERKDEMIKQKAKNKSKNASKKAKAAKKKEQAADANTQEAATTDTTTKS